MPELQGYLSSLTSVCIMGEAGGELVGMFVRVRVLCVRVRVCVCVCARVYICVLACTCMRKCVHTCHRSHDKTSFALPHKAVL